MSREINADVHVDGSLDADGTIHGVVKPFDPTKTYKAGTLVVVGEPSAAAQAAYVWPTMVDMGGNVLPITGTAANIAALKAKYPSPVPMTIYIAEDDGHVWGVEHSGWSDLTTTGPMVPAQVKGSPPPPLPTSVTVSGTVIPVAGSVPTPNDLGSVSPQPAAPSLYIDLQTRHMWLNDSLGVAAANWTDLGPIPAQQAAMPLTPQVFRARTDNVPGAVATVKDGTAWESIGLLSVGAKADLAALPPEVRMAYVGDSGDVWHRSGAQGWLPQTVLNGTVDRQARLWDTATSSWVNTRIPIVAAGSPSILVSGGVGANNVILVFPTDTFTAQPVVSVTGLADISALQYAPTWGVDMGWTNKDQVCIVPTYTPSGLNQPSSSLGQYTINWIAVQM